jgi:hypothetical protein
MRVIALGTLCDPAHDIKTLRHRQRHNIAVEDIGNDSGVPVGGELISHQLAIGPDSEDIGNVHNSGSLVRLIRGGCRDVGVETAIELDHLAGGLASTNGALDI